MSDQLKAYVIVYDISDDRRRNKVSNLLVSYGLRVQESVFIVGAKGAELVHLKARMNTLINHADDSVLIFDLGKYDGHKARYERMGRGVDDGLSRSCLVL